MSNFEVDRRSAPIFARTLVSVQAGQRRWRSKATPLSLLALLSSVAITPGLAQTAAPSGNNSGAIGPVIVAEPKRKPATRVQAETPRSSVHARVGGRTRTTAAKPVPGPAPAAAEAPRTPLNTNVVAISASRLGLTVLRDAGLASKSSTNRRCSSRAIEPPRKPRRARSACFPAMLRARRPGSRCEASPAARSTSSTTESGSVRRISLHA